LLFTREPTTYGLIAGSTGAAIAKFSTDNYNNAAESIVLIGVGGLRNLRGLFLLDVSLSELPECPSLFYKYLKYISSIFKQVAEETVIII
jgi:hypothetical protein